jgi:thiol-disulfide isomerase/thioredoxin
MPYVIAALVLVGTVATADLLLTVGVVRRLRELGAEAAAARAGGGGGESALPPGTPVGEFAATDVDGRPVTRPGAGLVGFLSPDCTPCKEQLPAFVRYATERPDVLAVVVGAPAEAANTVEALRPVATVVVEPPEGPLQQAFGVVGYPTFVLVRDGVMVTADHTLQPVAGRDRVRAAG